MAGTVAFDTGGYAAGFDFGVMRGDESATFVGVECAQFGVRWRGGQEFVGDIVVECEGLGFAGQFGESDGEFDAGSTHWNLAAVARKGR